MPETVVGLNSLAWSVVGVVIAIFSIVISLFLVLFSPSWEFLSLLIIVFSIIILLLILYFSRKKRSKTPFQKTQGPSSKNILNLQNANVGEIQISTIQNSQLNGTEAIKDDISTDIERIEQQIRMYSDIAFGNMWNWLPHDVGPNDPRYPKYQDYLLRFYSYLNLVDPLIRPDYQFVVNKFSNGYKDSERGEVGIKYHAIKKYCEGKAIELGKIRDEKLGTTSSTISKISSIRESQPITQKKDFLVNEKQLMDHSKTLLPDIEKWIVDINNCRTDIRMGVRFIKGNGSGSSIDKLPDPSRILGLHLNCREFDGFRNSIDQFNNVVNEYNRATKALKKQIESHARTFNFTQKQIAHHTFINLEETIYSLITYGKKIDIQEELEKDVQVDVETNTLRWSGTQIINQPNNTDRSYLIGTLAQTYKMYEKEFIRLDTISKEFEERKKELTRILSEQIDIIKHDGLILGVCDICSKWKKN